MPIWLWLTIALGAAVAAAAVVFVATLRLIGREVSELHEDETWATLPPTRSRSETSAGRPAEGAAVHGRDPSRHMSVR